MPKPTFLRLPVAKQQRMMNAAKTEFTHAVFQKASISNIIELAGVPRGSFYQYFEDKQDIFFYLLGLEGTRFTDLFKVVLADNDGQFFPTMTDFFDRVIDQLLESNDSQFYSNLFANMNFRTASHTAFGEAVHKHKEAKQYIVEHVDFSGLKVANDRQKELLFRTVMGAFAQSLAYYYNHQEGTNSETVQGVKERVGWLMTWLQNGVLMKENANA